MSRLNTLLAAVLAAGLSAPSWGDTVLIPSWANTVSRSSATGDYYAGPAGLATVGVAGFPTPSTSRGYLIFDLSGVTTPIRSLTLTGTVAHLRPTGDPGLDLAFYADMQFDVRDVATPISTLQSPTDTDYAAIFTDLADGALYGGAIVSNGLPHLGGPPPPWSPPDAPTTFNLYLPAAAVVAAEAARLSGGLWALGFSGMGSFPGGSTGVKGDVVASLIVGGDPSPSPVPEPSALTSGVLAGLIGLGYAWRRRRGAIV